jgi:hypothetical protein
MHVRALAGDATSPSTICTGDTRPLPFLSVYWHLASACPGWLLPSSQCLPWVPLHLASAYPGCHWHLASACPFRPALDLRGALPTGFLNPGRPVNRLTLRKKTHAECTLERWLVTPRPLARSALATRQCHPPLTCECCLVSWSCISLLVVRQYSRLVDVIDGCNCRLAICGM